MNINDFALVGNGKVYLAFVGMTNGATTGTPNLRTGRMSKWGCYYRFSSKAERDTFVKDYSFPQRKAVACSFNSGRKYSLGMSLRDYAEHVFSLPYYSAEEPYYK